jgi:hypothetical protein
VSGRHVADMSATFPTKEGLMEVKEMVAVTGGGRGVHGGSGHRLVVEGGTVAAVCLVVAHGFLASEGSVGADETVAVAGGTSAEECMVAVDTVAVVLAAAGGMVAADMVVLRDEDGGKDMKNRDIRSHLCMPLSDLLEE